MDEFSDAVAEGLEDQHAALSRLHFRSVRQSDLPPVIKQVLIVAQRNSRLRVTRAMNQTLESVPEFPNASRIDNRTINARIRALLADVAPGEVGEEPRNKTGGRELYGVQRTARRKKGRRLSRMRLVPYLELLLKTTPRNYERRFRELLIAGAATKGKPAMYLISTGQGPNSCKTCKALNGRVLVNDAYLFARAKLKPPLFHPNCIHRVQTGGLQSIGLDDYNERTHGPLVTLKDLNRMVARGDLETNARSRAVRL